MLLLDDIINLLSNEKASLSDALLKTKVLLHQIGRKELAAWVNSELEGYPRDATTALPQYRILPAHVKANFANVAWQYSSTPIPIGHLPQEEREMLEHAKMFESLAVLEDILGNAKEGKAIQPIPPEYYNKLGKPLEKSFSIQQAWCEVATHDIKGIPAHIRSRLLDFLLELKDNFGNATNDEDLKQKTTSFDAAGMFNNAIFGAGATILIGHQSSITATQTISGSELAEGVRKLVEQVAQILPTSGLPGSVQENSQVALAELREAATAATPDVSRLRRGLASLKHVMEHATGHVVATGILTLIAELLSRAAH